MRRLLGYIFMILAVATLFLFLLNQILQPVFLSNINLSLVMYFFVFLSIIGIFAGLKDTLGSFQKFSKNNGKKDIIHEDISIASFYIDEKNCDWYKDRETNWIYHNNTLTHYMKFIEGNDIVVHYEKLNSKDKKMFNEVLSFLKSRLCDLDDNVLKTVHVDFVNEFREMNTQNFYKALILINRKPSLLNNQDEAYDIRKEDIRRGKNYSDDFYAYKISSIKTVHKLLPIVWPEIDLYNSLIKNLAIRGSLKRFRQMFMRTTNPIFDINLVNNTSITQIIRGVEIIIIDDEWGEVIGIPPRAQILKPIQTPYLFTLDFSKEVNSFVLDPQISIGPDQKTRVKIQFKCKKYIGINKIRFRFIGACCNFESQTFILSG